MEYYTYAYLREDGTPYYIGKGKNRRAYKPHYRNGKIWIIPDRKNILFLKKNLTESEAVKHEKYMIFIFGREDNGNGILKNLTDGGDGTSGIKRKHSEDTKNKISKTSKGRKYTLEQRERRKIEQLGKQWWTNGINDKLSKISPGNGWRRGRTKSKPKKLTDLII